MARLWDVATGTTNASLSHDRVLVRRCRRPTAEGQRLITACERQGVPRLVLASSSSVYGHTDGTPCREDDPARPLSPYGVTKLAAEQLCLAHARRCTAVTSVLALRYFTVHGPRQRPDMLISRALRAALSGVPLRLFGDGSQRRDFTYIDDAVAATRAAATAPARAEVVNVGGGSSTSVSDVLTTIESVSRRTRTAPRIPYDRIPAAPRPGDRHHRPTQGSLSSLCVQTERPCGRWPVDGASRRLAHEGEMAHYPLTLFSGR
ncbi:NAD-dependent epimerase/dehydratase family protein [Streptomyces sp. NPDC001793]|uniref:NAD-dependent epimerase/dehydratase family protein n=1 Tax=Streptomyces sp. NPDC001793 TaxID=3154657 RepID=UPI00331FDC18